MSPLALPLQAAASPEEAVAMALAKITGHTQMRGRSLLTAHEDYTTLQFVSPSSLDKPGACVWGLGRCGLLGGGWGHRMRGACRGTAFKWCPYLWRRPPANGEACGRHVRARPRHTRLT